MSISQTPPDHPSGAGFSCPQCQAPLPLYAAFCSSCGERIDKQKHVSSLLQDELDFSARYRITSLIRRRPYVNLYFALDNRQSSQSGQQRTVAIRDIDISSLEGEVRMSAIELVQQEYDLLRRWQLPHVMPVTDLRYSQEHLYVVTGKSPTRRETQENVESTIAADDSLRLYTLQDFLQSGQGLPSETRAIEWMEHLCLAVDRLHSHKIVIGDLDPYTVILNTNSEQAQPALMISWLLPKLREMLPPPTLPTTHMSYFGAPEALLGTGDFRSDIYSLGAILYLLLTGTPPDESALRSHRRLRSPREMNSRVSIHVDECIMQALSVDPAERFQSITAMIEALHNHRFRRPLTMKREQQNIGEQPATIEEEVETVRIVPLSYKNVERWQASRPQTIPHRPLSPHSAQWQEQSDIPEAAREQHSPQQSLPLAPSGSGEIVEAAPSSPVAAGAPEQRVTADSAPVVDSVDAYWELDTISPEDGVQLPTSSRPLETRQPSPTWKQRITGLLPAIAPQQRKIEPGGNVPVSDEMVSTPQSGGEQSWFRQFQRFILGQPQPVTAAAAIIETPLRVQPNQGYTIRLHVMGRDEPVLAPGAKRGAEPAGLSALVHGDKVVIEVRSALYQSYAYIVQRAQVTVPANGYVAEVTIPMRPLASGPSGRRDRLHIFFLNEKRQPLYDKPFVVELFISHLVQPGREGHNVLTLPV
ncbi:MAG TPA: inactive serine/threonine-protein kinase VRK3 [Ktedonobacteraceae bacterium]|nr:inactive serine/threonine-protein kinase VRK3 [Ktedonobacteraceae bacterium]